MYHHSSGWCILHGRMQLRPWHLAIISSVPELQREPMHGGSVMKLLRPEPSGTVTTDASVGGWGVAARTNRLGPGSGDDARDDVGDR